MVDELGGFVVGKQNFSYRVSQAWRGKVPEERKLGIASIWESYAQWPRLWSYLAASGVDYNTVLKQDEKFALNWVYEKALTTQAKSWLETLWRRGMVTSLARLRFFLLCRSLAQQDQDLLDIIFDIWEKGRAMALTHHFEAAVQAAGDCVLVVVAVMWVVRPNGFEEVQKYLVRETDQVLWAKGPGESVSSESFSDQERKEREGDGRGVKTGSLRSLF